MVVVVIVVFFLDFLRSLCCMLLFVEKFSFSFLPLGDTVHARRVVWSCKKKSSFACLFTIEMTRLLRVLSMSAVLFACCTGLLYTSFLL